MPTHIQGVMAMNNQGFRLFFLKLVLMVQFMATHRHLEVAQLIFVAIPLSRVVLFNMTSALTQALGVHQGTLPEDKAVAAARPPS